MTFLEEPVLIWASDIRQLHIKKIPIVKVQWRHRLDEKATMDIKSCKTSIVTCLRLKVHPNPLLSDVLCFVAPFMLKAMKYDNFLGCFGRYDVFLVCFARKYSGS